MRRALFGCHGRGAERLQRPVRVRRSPALARRTWPRVAARCASETADASPGPGRSASRQSTRSRGRTRQARTPTTAARMRAQPSIAVGAALKGPLRRHLFARSSRWRLGARAPSSRSSRPDRARISPPGVRRVHSHFDRRCVAAGWPTTFAARRHLRTEPAINTEASSVPRATVPA